MTPTMATLGSKQPRFYSYHVTLVTSLAQQLTERRIQNHIDGCVDQETQIALASFKQEPVPSSHTSPGSRSRVF